MSKTRGPAGGGWDRRYLVAAIGGAIAVIVGVSLVVAAGSSDRPRLEAATINMPTTTTTAEALGTPSSAVEDTTITTVADEGSSTTTAAASASTTSVARSAPSPAAGSPASSAPPARGAPAPVGNATEVLSYLYQQQVPFTSFAPIGTWVATDPLPAGMTSASQYAPDPDKNGFMGLGEVDVFGEVGAASAYEGDIRQTNQQLADTMQAMGMSSRSDLVRCGPIVVVLVGATEPNAPSQAAASVKRFVSDSIPAVRSALEARYGPC